MRIRYSESGLLGVVRRILDARRQKRAVQAIQEHGGSVLYDYEFDHGYLEPAWPRPSWAQTRFGDLASTVVFAHIRADTDLKYVAKLSGLLSLSLEESQTSDSGLSDIEPLCQLESLSLRNTAISDAGLAHIAGWRLLESLDLAGTNVTDAGLRHLKRLGDIIRLNLASTRVTDAGLCYLRRMRGLERLDLSGTCVTDGAMREFEGALPYCVITSDKTRG
jgi:hypothetical protein